MKEDVFRIQDLDAVDELDVPRGDHARAALGERQGGGLHGVHADRDVLEVQQEVDHVLLQALDGGVLVQHAIDFHLGDRVTRDGRQQHAAQGVAEGVAVATLQRLDHDLGAVRGDALDVGAARAQHLGSGNRHGQSLS